MKLILSLLFILLLGFSKASANDDVIFTISIQNSASYGFHNRTVYADDSSNLGIVTEGQWSSSIDLTVGDRITGTSNIDLNLEDGKLTIGYNFLHQMQAGPFTDIWNPVNAGVQIQVWAPVGDRLRVKMGHTATKNGVSFRRSDPPGSPVVDFDVTGTASGNSWVKTIFYKGKEYGLLFDVWNNGYSSSRIESLFNVFGKSSFAVHTLTGNLVIEANNLSNNRICFAAYPPYPGTPAYQGSPGHAWVEYHDSINKLSGSFGAYPRPGDYRGLIIGPGKISPNDIEKKVPVPIRKICFRVPIEKIDALKQMTDGFEKSGIPYSLLALNCVDFIKKIASDLQLNLPETNSRWFIDEPIVLYDSLGDILNSSGGSSGGGTVTEIPPSMPALSPPAPPIPQDADEFAFDYHWLTTHVPANMEEVGARYGFLTSRSSEATPLALSSGESVSIKVIGFDVNNGVVALLDPDGEVIDAQTTDLKINAFQKQGTYSLFFVSQRRMHIHAIPIGVGQSTGGSISISYGEPLGFVEETSLTCFLHNNGNTLRVIAPDTGSLHRFWGSHKLEEGGWELLQSGSFNRVLDVPVSGLPKYFVREEIEANLPQPNP